MNINSKQLKTISFKGDVDSLELVIVGSSFVYNNEFYFLSRKISRSNPPLGAQGINTPFTTIRHMYKVVGDTIEFITNINTTITSSDANAFTFVNLDGNCTHVQALQSNIFAHFRIGEYNNGVETQLSDTIFGDLLRGIIQNPLDSTYQLFFSNSSVLKLDKNFQIIDSIHLLVEENSARWFNMPYFQSKVSENPILSGVLLPTNVNDSICIVSASFSSDSTFLCNWKRLVLYVPVSVNPNNYVYNSVYNEDSHEKHFFYSFNKKQCFPGFPNCISQFTVLKHDTLNNTHWELEFGGDAGYIVSKVLALQDSGCVVFVQRTNNVGSADSYYVYIDKDGNVTNNFLPLLGGEEITIPVKVVFTLPQPNLQLFVFG